MKLGKSYTGPHIEGKVARALRQDTHDRKVRVEIRRITAKGPGALFTFETWDLDVANTLVKIGHLRPYTYGEVPETVSAQGVDVAGLKLPDGPLGYACEVEHPALLVERLGGLDAQYGDGTILQLMEVDLVRELLASIPPEKLRKMFNITHTPNGRGGVKLTAFLRT